MNPDPLNLYGRLAAYPRVELIHRPTPIRKLARLTAELGGPEIWIKRDDLTGMAFGGNKSRKLEFILPDILAKKADVLVTWASLQSNWAMLTAAACVRYGVQPVLVLFKTYDLPPEPDGNILLDRLLGADIRFKEAGRGKLVTQATALAAAEDVAAEFRAAGKNVYVIPVGGSVPAADMDRPLGAVAYVDAFAEMLAQTRAAGFVPDAVVHSTGSGSTQAGLLLGARALAPQTRVVGISVSDPKDSFSRIVREVVVATERELGTGTIVAPEDVLVFDDYIRDGYGIVNREVAEVIRRVFRAEGIVLDPVYTSKAFIGLMDLIARGFFKPDAKIVFFHTGGTPALFPNRAFLV
ncbi:MAG: D-cysteine desulfhydrase family protein [Candidatus Aminicenantes bacterium]|nr:D-cysteine desulfhydrase family protein [Candidatus Aminicenantes bacterium]